MATMQVSIPQCKLPSESALAAAEAEIRKAADKFAEDGIARLRSGGLPEDPEQYERELHASSDALGGAVLSASLRAHEAEAGCIEVDGKSWRDAGMSRTAVMTSFGELEYERRRFRRSNRGAAVVPADEAAGLIGGRSAPLAARQLLLLHSRMPLRETVSAMRQLGPVRCAESTVEGLALAFGAEWDRVRGEALEEIRAREALPAEQVAQIVVQLDGVFLRMKENQGVGGSGPACFREASTGVVMLRDKEGKCLRKIYAARMPEAGKASLLRDLAGEVASARRLHPQAELIAMSDGAALHWTFLDGLEPEAAVLDYLHAAQNLKRAIDAVYGADAPESGRAFRKWKRVLRDDPEGPRKLLNWLTYWFGRTGRDRTVGQVKEYFRGHAGRIKYAESKAANRPIATGEVEAGNKMLIIARMRRSGQKWTEAGGQAVMDLRALDKSGRLDAAWEFIKKSAKKCTMIYEEPEDGLRLAA